MTLLPNCFRESRRARSAHRVDRRISGALLLLALFGVTGLSSSVSAAGGGGAKRAAGRGGLQTPLAAYWKFTGNLFYNSPAAPVITESAAYFASGNRLYAVNLSDGSLIWRYPSDTNLSTLIQTTPLVTKDTVYAGAGDGIYAIERATGKLKWHFLLRSGVATTPVLSSGRIYFTTDDSRFYELDESENPLSGIWHKGTDAGVPMPTDMAADFIISNDIIYYISSDQALHATSLTAGTQRWAPIRLDGDAHSAPVLNGESLYVSAGNSLVCYNASNGRRRWAITLPASAAAAPAVDDDGTSYVVASDRTVYAIDFRGNPLWSKHPKLDFEVLAKPLIVDKTLVIGTAQGGVYLLDTTTGAVKWNYVISPSGMSADTVPTNANVMTTPVYSNGALYILTDDGTLTAFRHDAPDAVAPIITFITPSAGDYISGRPPFSIAARVVDEGSGVDLDSLTILLDGHKIPRRPGGMDAFDQIGYYFDPDKKTIDYITMENDGGASNGLKDGHHTLTISAKDWMGNAITKSITFYTDDTIPRRSSGANSLTRQGSGGGRGRPNTGDDISPQYNGGNSPD